MIYVILSAEIIKRDPSNLGLILKIGYCKDDRAKVRTATYLTENPTIKTLFTIPGGTEQDEKNLHHHFRKYLKYGNEWFSYNQEILDFFTTHTTKESLEELDLHLSQNKLIKLQKERNTKFLENKQKYINPILHSLGDIEILEYVKKQEELVGILNNLFLTSSDIDSYFKSNYPYIDFNTPEKLSKKVKKILLEIDNLKQFSDKMRFLYSLHMDEEIAKQVLDNIYDTRFAKYYWTISASRAGTLHYRSGELEKEYQSILHPEDTSIIDGKVKDEILKTFSISERYTKSYLKSKLGEIYTTLSYNKTPKANDLGEYFELQPCQITNKETGKKDHGFKIVKIKGDQDL